ncbi:MAG: hypothetical protein ACYC8T_29355, partial [Myxococcaceae bacterium]
MPRPSKKKALRRIAARRPGKAARPANGKAKAPLYDAQAVKKLARDASRWNAEVLAPALAKTPLRRPKYETDSGIPIPAVLTA